MIQDIKPELKNEYINIEPQNEDYVMAFGENSICVKNTEELEYMSVKEYRCKYDTELTYLFSVGEIRYFLSNEKVELPGYTYIKMFETRTRHPKQAIMTGATAWHLNLWYRQNKFCGECGHRMIHDDKLRMVKCEHCGNQVFPRIAPAVIVGIYCGDKMLLTKYAAGEYKRYALVAGFTEIGETAEETVRREVMEETGLNVENITYYKSQPWGFNSNLLMGFFCEADDKDKIIMDKDELSVAEWVDYKDIPEDIEGLSLTRNMMTYFKVKRAQKNAQFNIKNQVREQQNEG